MSCHGARARGHGLGRRLRQSGQRWLVEGNIIDQTRRTGMRRDDEGGPSIEDPNIHVVRPKIAQLWAAAHDGIGTVAMAASPARSARGIASACDRSAGDSRTLRDDIARPSGSRRVGWTRISSGSARSRTSCRMHGHLLRVLLAEYRDVRLHDVEQDQAHRRDAVEMAGP